MTSNQIAYWNMLETRRANLETIRHNKVYEGETQRHNRSQESIGWGNLQETSRHNLAYEKETRRHNVVGERQNKRALRENKRHNIATENLSKYNYDLQHSDRVYSANLNYDSSIYRTNQDVMSRQYSTDRNANMSKYATDRKFQTDMNTFIGKYPATAVALGLLNNRGKVARDATNIWTKIQNQLPTISVERTNKKRNSTKTKQRLDYNTIRRYQQI